MAPVVDVVCFQKYCVEYHGVAKVFREYIGLLEVLYHKRAHPVDGHTVSSGGGVIFVQRPTEEVRFGRDVGDVWRVDEPGDVQIVVDGVAALHQHRKRVVKKHIGGLGRVVASGKDQGDHHAVSAVGGADHIDGEVLGGESDGVVCGDHRGHILTTLVGFVVDVELLAVAEIGVGDGHLRGLPVGGLPLLAPPVGEGDVVGGQHGIALLVFAFHGGHAHARLLRHTTRDGEVHHGAVSVNAATFPQMRGRDGRMNLRHRMVIKPQGD